jgi:hypothetical protein
MNSMGLDALFQVCRMLLSSWSRPMCIFLRSPLPTTGRTEAQQSAQRDFLRELAKGHSVTSFDVTIDGVFLGGAGEVRPSARHKQFSGYVVIQSFRRLKAVK